MARVLLADLTPAESDERLAAGDLRQLTPHPVVGWSVRTWGPDYPPTTLAHDPPESRALRTRSL